MVQQDLFLFVKVDIKTKAFFNHEADEHQLGPTAIAVRYDFENKLVVFGKISISPEIQLGNVTLHK